MNKSIGWVGKDTRCELCGSVIPGKINSITYIITSKDLKKEDFDDDTIKQIMLKPAEIHRHTWCDEAHEIIMNYIDDWEIFPHIWIDITPKQYKEFLYSLMHDLQEVWSILETDEEKQKVGEFLNRIGLKQINYPSAGIPW